MDETKNAGGAFRSMMALDNLPFSILLLVTFLLPIFFIPSIFFSLQFSKVTLVFVGVISAFCIYLISLLKKGVIELPTGYTYWSLLLLVLVTGVSAFASGTMYVSLIGYGFETGTFSFIAIVSLLLMLASLLCRLERRLIYVYGALFLSVIVLTLFHVIRFIFGADILFQHFFPNAATTLVGDWYDLGVIYGAVLLSVLITLEMLSFKRSAKVLLLVLFFCSLFILTVVQFSIVWVVLACFSLIFFVFFFSFERVSNAAPKHVGTEGEVVHISRQKMGTRRISILTLVVLIISLASLLPLGGIVGNFLATSLDISVVQVRPSWTATIDITKNIFKHDPLLGSGPNTFLSQWQLSKPADTNITPFWGADFNTGVGFIPTLFATTGILGILAWVAFLASFVILGLRVLFIRPTSQLLHYFSVSSFFVAAYLWVILIVYIPTVSGIALTFLFTGIFFAVAHMLKVLTVKPILLSAYPRASFVFVLCFVLLIILGLAFGYLFLQKAVSAYYFERSKSLVAQGISQLDQRENYLIRAINLGAVDVYYRELAEIYLTRIGVLISQVTTPEPSAEAQQIFEQLLNNAVVSANMAIAYDAHNYQNWASLGGVYGALVPLGIAGAYESAIQAYDEAVKRSPQHPELMLIRARLEGYRNDLVKAKEYVSKALALKPNYSEAIFFRSQIEVEEGNLRGAIESLEGVALISPQNAGVFFELGLLKYNNNDFRGSATAFERAVDLVPEYSNARYFLGLSYARLGRTDEAIDQFEIILELNPGTQEVEFILGNLRAGRGPFENLSASVDDEPEKRDDLPLSDE